MLGKLPDNFTLNIIPLMFNSVFQIILNRIYPRLLLIPQEQLRSYGQLRIISEKLVVELRV